MTRRVALKPPKSIPPSERAARFWVALVVLGVACAGPQDSGTTVAPATQEALSADLAEVQRLLNETQRVEAEILPILDLAGAAATRETQARRQQILRAMVVCGGNAEAAPEDRPAALLAGALGDPGSVTCFYEQLASDRDAVAPSSLVATGDNPLRIEIRRPMYIGSNTRLDEVLAPARAAHDALDAFVTRGIAELPMRGAPEDDAARAVAERVQVARDELRERVSALRPTATKVHPDLVVSANLKDQLDTLAVTLGAVSKEEGQITRMVVRPDGAEVDMFVANVDAQKRARALESKHAVKFGTLEVASKGPAVLAEWPTIGKERPGRRLEVRANDADAVALLIALWDRKSSILAVGARDLRVSGRAGGSAPDLSSRLRAASPGLEAEVAQIPGGKSKAVSLQLTDVPSDVLGVLLGDIMRRNVAVTGDGPIVSVAARDTPADGVLAGIAAGSDLRMRQHDSILTLTARDELPEISAPRTPTIDFHVVGATPAESFGFLRALTRSKLGVPCDAKGEVHLNLRGVTPRQAARAIQVAGGADPVVDVQPMCLAEAWNLDAAPTHRTAVFIGISERRVPVALVRGREAGGVFVIRDGDALPGGVSARVGSGRLELYRGQTFLESFELTLAPRVRPTASHRLTATITGGESSVALFRAPDGRSYTVVSGQLVEGESLKIEPGRVELRYETELFGRKETVVARWRL